MLLLFHKATHLEKKIKSYWVVLTSNQFLLYSRTFSNIQKKTAFVKCRYIFQLSERQKYIKGQQNTSLTHPYLIAVLWFQEFFIIVRRVCRELVQSSSSSPGSSLWCPLQSGVSVRKAALVMFSEKLKGCLAVGERIHFKSVLCFRRKWLYSSIAYLQLPFVSK